ncbi:ATP-binding protein [Bifidobacterium jacchi]|uniref:IstB-like ATP-binding domain-containing protein n=1 Tax=Bifidobacterium jacchi TaxID=2490545 RepID=A0A5N5RED5_9BIFI|nr:ATP-binding protein [Bifidobacterium jacchi]KAB5604161.1 hypothetical protein EHS19_10020 [Bifidobacterium jacchi]
MPGAPRRAPAPGRRCVRLIEHGAAHPSRGRRGPRHVHRQARRRTRPPRQAPLPAGRSSHPRHARRTRRQPRTGRLARRLAWVERRRNIVVQGYCGSGKSWIICALARQACRSRYRARYIRVPDLEEEWRQAADKPQGRYKRLKRYSGFTALALDEWLFDPPKERFRAFLFELMERRHDTVSPPCSPPNTRKDSHQRLGGAHSDAIMDRIVHNTTWIETGEWNMREHASGK